MSNWKDLGTLLMEYGLVSNDDIKEGLRLQKETGLRLGEALAELGKVTKEDIDWILSKQLDIPFVIVEDVRANAELLSKFEKDFLTDNRILPLYETDDQISIVMEDPFNKPALDRMKEHIRKNVSVSIGNGLKIEELLKKTFQKVGLPELVSAVSSAIEKIQDTSFYRMDFIVDENSCVMNVYGAGILKHIGSLKGQFSIEEIFTAFDELSIPFLYEHADAQSGRFVAVYPLINEINIDKFPAVVGTYGLFRPDRITFSGAKVYGLTHLFSLEHQVCGYPYIETKEKGGQSGKIIFVIDAAPAEFQDYYVNLHIPEKCPSCGGAGCAVCKDLGYEFMKIEGIYSSEDLKDKLQEVWNGKD